MRETFAGICLILSVVFALYLIIIGPNVNKYERVDDRCVLHVYHDHRLFEADKPEVRTIYCKEAR